MFFFFFFLFEPGFPLVGQVGFEHVHTIVRATLGAWRGCRGLRHVHRRADSGAVAHGVDSLVRAPYRQATVAHGLDVEGNGTAVRAGESFEVLGIKVQAVGGSHSNCSQ